MRYLLTLLALFCSTAYAAPFTCQGDVSSTETFTLTCDPTIPNVDCAGEWGAWYTIEDNEGSCFGGDRIIKQQRDYIVSTPPSGSGAACPDPQFRTLTATCLPSSADVGDTYSVSPNGRYLRKNGEPFLVVADTAWRACSGMTAAQMDTYLETRAAQGVNTVHGCIPITDYSPGSASDLIASTNPMVLGESFWSMNDHFVAKATSLGMAVVQPIIWGPHSDYFITSKEVARAYAKAIASRYKQYRNMIFLPVGEYHKVAWTGSFPNWDKTPAFGAAGKAWVEEYALGARAGANAASLIVEHPDAGRTPREHFINSPWLDAYMLQSYMDGDHNTSQMALDYAATPVKPFWQGEIFYVGGEFNGITATSDKVRAAAYQSWMSGGAGFSYGHGNVWQFADGWQAALNHESAAEIFGVFGGFTATHHDENNTPAQDLLNSPGVVTDYRTYQTAMRTPEGAVFYTPRGENLSVNVAALGTTSITAHWVNPRDGSTTAPVAVPLQAAVSFDPPGAPADTNDYLLVLAYGTVPVVDGGGAAGSFTVNWLWPTINEDGTPVVQPLMGEIVYGAQSGTYTGSVNTVGTQLPNGKYTHTVSGQAPGTYYVAMRVRDANDEVSGYSNELTLTVSGGGGNSMALTDGLLYQIDVNTRGQSATVPYDHVNAQAGTNAGSPGTTGTGDNVAMVYNDVDGQYTSVPVGDDAWMAGPWTMAIRGDFFSTTSGDHIAGIYSESFSANVRFEQVSGSVRWRVTNADTANRAVADTAPTNGMEVHVLTWDGVDTFTHYKAGADVGSVTWSGYAPLTGVTAYDEFGLGANLRSTQHVAEADADIQWFAVWNRVLSAAEIAQLDDSGNPFLVSAVVLTVQSATHSQTADAPTLQRKDTLEPASASHAQSADVPALLRKDTLAPADALHGHAADGVVLQTGITMQPGDAVHGQSADVVVLQPHAVIAPADATHGQAADGVVLQPHDTLAPDSALHTQSADVVELYPHDTLQPASAQHGQSADSPTLSLAVSLNPSGALHAQAADNVAATAKYLLNVAGALHAQAADAPVLRPKWLLDIASATHSQQTDAPEISGAEMLSIAEALHAQGADSLILTPAFILSPHSATHAQTAEHLVTAAGYLLEVQHAEHAHTADSPALASKYLLDISPALHAQLADAITLAQDTALVVAGAVHSQHADNVIFVGTVFYSERIMVIDAEDRVAVLDDLDRIVRVTG